MNFEMFEKMYAMFMEFVYEVLAIFGIKKDENGNLVEG